MHNKRIQEAALVRKEGYWPTRGRKKICFAHYPTMVPCLGERHQQGWRNPRLSIHFDTPLKCVLLASTCMHGSVFLFQHFFVVFNTQIIIVGKKLLFYFLFFQIWLKQNPSACLVSSVLAGLMPLIQQLVSLMEEFLCQHILGKDLVKFLTQIIRLLLSLASRLSLQFWPPLLRWGGGHAHKHWKSKGASKQPRSHVKFVVYVLEATFNKWAKNCPQHFIFQNTHFFPIILDNKYPSKNLFFFF